MKKLLIKLGFIVNISTNLQTSSADFAERLGSITEEESFSFNFNFGSKKEFIGVVSGNWFMLKSRKQYYKRARSSFSSDSSRSFPFGFAPTADGTFREKEGRLIVETEINGFNFFWLCCFAFLIFCFIACIFVVIRDGRTDSGAILTPLFIGALFIVPYFGIKNSVEFLKNELEKKFNFLANSDQATFEKYYGQNEN